VFVPVEATWRVPIDASVVTLGLLPMVSVGGPLSEANSEAVFNIAITGNDRGVLRPLAKTTSCYTDPQHSNAPQCFTKKIR
jgi:hypothetical protein